MESKLILISWTARGDAIEQFSSVAGWQPRESLSELHNEYLAVVLNVAEESDPTAKSGESNYYQN